MRIDPYQPHRLEFWCPGCERVHAIGLHPNGWTWDGDTEKPTISPSILVNKGQAHPGLPICHSFIRKGVWDFLPDSTHRLAGNSAPMVPIADALGVAE